MKRILFVLCSSAILTLWMTASACTGDNHNHSHDGHNHEGHHHSDGGHSHKDGGHSHGDHNMHGDHKMGDHSGKDQSRKKKTEGQTYEVEYMMAADAKAGVPLNKLFDLRVKVKMADGSNAAGITVKVDARMPEHKHGMNVKPKISAKDGDFMVEGMLFHMPGWWEMTVDVTKEGSTEQVKFNVVLQP